MSECGACGSNFKIGDRVINDNGYRGVVRSGREDAKVWVDFDLEGVGDGLIRVEYLRPEGSGPCPLSSCKICNPPARDWVTERNDVLGRFVEELAKATGDGSRKRQAGEKPPWYEDDAHEGAIFSHLTKWKRGELVDPDSGAHPLVHLAWRALAIACREGGNIPTSSAPE